MTSATDPPRRDAAGDSEEIALDPSAVARRRVVLPAKLLMICSGLLIVAALGAAGALAWGSLYATDENERVAGLIFAGVCVAMVPYFVVMMIGAARMRQCRRHGLAKAAAIMAIATVVTGWGCGLFVLPVGVWALVVLLNRDVKRLFGVPTDDIRNSADPHRRDGAGDYDDFHGDPAALTRARLVTPATCLLGGAMIGVFLCLALTAWGVALLFFDTPHPMSGTDEGAEVGAVMAFLSLIGAAYLAVIAVGAARMRQFRRYRFARAAAIMATVSIVPLLYLSVLVLPFGVWALALMRNPAVRSQFQPSQTSVNTNDP